MKKHKINFEYDSGAEDLLDAVVEVCSELGAESEWDGEFTIKYWKKKKKFKKKVLKLLDDRINYYTGGEEMKSMHESVCDSRIVDELNQIKETLLK